METRQTSWGKWLIAEETKRGLDPGDLAWGEPLGNVYVMEASVQSSSKYRHVYVGFTTQYPSERWKQHVYSAMANSVHYKNSFGHYIRKYGKDGLVCRQVASGVPVAYERLEQILAERRNDVLFNNARCGISSPMYDTNACAKVSNALSGRKLSLETRTKLSGSLRGKKKSLEHAANISKAQRGVKKHSLETRAKIGDAFRGKKLPSEHRAKLSEAMRGERNHAYGKVRSPEHCSKLRDARLGKKHSLETRAKIAESNRGKKRSPEACLNISIAKRGEKNPNYGKRKKETHYD